MGLLKTQAIALSILLGTTLSVSADSVTLISTRDNTLISTGTPNSNALGDVYCGRTGNFGGISTLVRGMLRFDLAGQIPAGSTITSVSLRLTLTEAASNGAATQTHTVHRVLADWGEGTSYGTGGQGSPATTGDATWQHTFFPGSFWGAVGGDYVAAVTSSAVVGNVIGSVVTLPTTAQFVADAQDMLDNPAADFGWMLRGNESTLFTARRFASRETVGSEPRLTVLFDPPANCLPDLNTDGIVDAADLALLLGSWGPCPGCIADLNGDDVVNAADLALLLGAWGPCP